MTLSPFGKMVILSSHCSQKRLNNGIQCGKIEILDQGRILFNSLLNFIKIVEDPVEFYNMISPDSIIMVNVISPNHVDDVPVVEPNQHDDVHAIPEPVLVDEDEDPEEEEFKEEEEPQEEEDDIEVDIEEDDNEPEVTYPYEEVDPLNPPPSASELEPEDVIKVENTVEPKDETFPASVHEVGESSTAPFLQENSDGLLPGLMRRDINSLFSRMASLSR
ncbi:hypothetical protein Tco_0276353 [Tanacetum coccineum]